MSSIWRGRQKEYHVLPIQRTQCLLLFSHNTLRRVVQSSCERETTWDSVIFRYLNLLVTLLETMYAHNYKGQKILFDLVIVFVQRKIVSVFFLTRNTFIFLFVKDIFFSHIFFLMDHLLYIPHLRFFLNSHSFCIHYLSASY